jgi:hypothetical protein
VNTHPPTGFFGDTGLFMGIELFLGHSVATDPAAGSWSCQNLRPEDCSRILLIDDDFLHNSRTIPRNLPGRQAHPLSFWQLMVLRHG